MTTSATATCSVATAARTRNRDRPADALRPPSRRFGEAPARHERNAGTTAQTHAPSALATTTNSVAGAPTPSCASRGTSAGPYATSTATAPCTSSSASMPAVAPSTSASAANGIAMRSPLAPSAARTASSACRASARTSSRFATFASATSSTSPAAAASIHSVCAMPPVISSRKGTTCGTARESASHAAVAPPDCSRGNASASRGRIVASSRPASSTVAPGARRATPA